MVRRIKRKVMNKYLRSTNTEKNKLMKGVLPRSLNVRGYTKQEKRDLMRIARNKVKRETMLIPRGTDTRIIKIYKVI